MRAAQIFNTTNHFYQQVVDHPESLSQQIKESLLTKLLKARRQVRWGMQGLKTQRVPWPKNQASIVTSSLLTPTPGGCQVYQYWAHSFTSCVSYSTSGNLAPNWLSASSHDGPCLTKTDPDVTGGNILISLEDELSFGGKKRLESTDKYQQWLNYTFPSPFRNSLIYINF